jgi:putative membrane protein (TIGR04086 family)
VSTLQAKDIGARRNTAAEGGSLERSRTEPWIEARYLARRKVNVKSIRWGCILLGGVLAEAALFLIVLPLIFLAGEDSLDYGMPPASFVATFLFGWWVARKATRRRVLHGALVGVVAMVILAGMMLGQAQTTAYVVAHVLKVLGGAAGGFVAAKRSQPNAVSDARPV